ncbi:MAG: hypothetical protein IPG17_13575 [Sandaracinaceae bacterium]|nr:hypothetical protein [Sandaracinaceae bacterium]MBP7683236.1 hypothetical protein [Deltaproteobacteria bacterium]MBK7151651.1 hypothetical protein [Sandaracinaceae bacterium]MBK7775740.1 hypothetical protein [Sandaracinaceae bacterium]MBK8409377.1 hypothetical protein [Sandaracinaceae bacterium]
MDWKQLLTEQSMKLMQDPRVQKVMQDERVVKTMMRGLQMRQQVQAQVDERVETVAESLNLATKKELREIKRSMKKMERDLSKAQAALAEARAKAKD